MSRESIQFPSAKQILSYQNGDFDVVNVHDFFRFHDGDKFYWIEHTKGKYRVCFRGSLSIEFVPVFKILYEDVDLKKCIFYFNRSVYRFLRGTEYAL